MGNRVKPYAYDRCNKERPKRKQSSFYKRPTIFSRTKRLYLPPKFFEVLRGELATLRDHDSHKL